MWSLPKSLRSLHAAPRRRRGVGAKTLGCERLENRRVLAGVVNVVIDPNGVPGALLLTGDVDNNSVSVAQTENPNEFRIVGLDGTLLQLNQAGQTLSEVTVNNIFGDITVTLARGADRFVFDQSSSPAGLPSMVPGNLLLNNEGTGDVNIVGGVAPDSDGVWVAGDLVVTSAAGMGGNTLEIRNSRIAGFTSVTNGDGTNVTKVVNGTLNGDPGVPALSIVNGAGFDVLEISANSQLGSGQFATVTPALSVNNGSGPARTTITGASPTGAPPAPGFATTTIYGDAILTNGQNLAGTLDILTIEGVNILGDLVVSNGVGSTATTINNSAVGSNFVELAPSVATVSNATGFDTFSASNSEFPWGLAINNDAAAAGASNFGSRTTIVGGSIGAAIGSRDDGLLFNGDGGQDVINVSATSIRGWLRANVRSGKNELSLTNGANTDRLSFDGFDGEDKLILSSARVRMEVFASFGGGNDQFTITGMNSVTDWPDGLLGLVTIRGGDGVDTANVDPFFFLASDFEVRAPTTV